VISEEERGELLGKELSDQCLPSESVLLLCTVCVSPTRGPLWAQHDARSLSLRTNLKEDPTPYTVVN
jgi:hypothetical protein